MMDWPRYMVAKRLRSGTTAYYWRPLVSDFDAGFTLHAEALGADVLAARQRTRTS